MSTTEKLFVQLAPAELAERQDECQRVLDALDQAELEKKAAQAAHKEKAEALLARLGDLRSAIKQRGETRAVEVQERHDDVAKEVHTIVVATGEVVRTRAMTTAERQQKLKILDLPKAKAAGGKREAPGPFRPGAEPSDAGPEEA